MITSLGQLNKLIKRLDKRPFWPTESEGHIPYHVMLILGTHSRKLMF